MEVDPVILEFHARTARFQADLRRTTKSVDEHLGRQGARVQKLEAEFRRSSGAISGTLKGLAATLATAFTGRELAGLLDSFTRFQNQLRVAGLEGQELLYVQQQLRDIGREYGADLESLGSTFSRIAQVQGDLGASTEQIIQLNRIVAASLKVAGTDAQTASGALLQLGQAFGSGVVRAEEFNSILEGALPLAQAAARGIDGYGGSVAKLRADIAEGNVTSKQFFEGVLKGGIQTLEDAESATLTLSGAVTSLRNELTLYFGEAGKGSGATEALATAIQALADNLDTLIPIIAIVGTGLGVGYVTNAVRARLATVALGAAATATGRAMLAAFGGPVGLAITAVAVGLAYVATEAETAQQRIDRLNASADTAAREADEMEAKLRAAGVAMDTVGIASDTAKDGIDGVTGAARSAKGELYALQQQAIRTAVALVDLDITENNRRRVANNRLRNSPELNQTASGLARQANGDSRRAGLDAEAAALDNEFRELTRKRNAIIAGIVNGVDFDAGGPPASPTGTVSSRSGSGSSRTTVTDPAEVLRRFYEDQRRADEEILQAKLALATSVEDRADLERDILASQAQARREEIKANTDLTQEQRKALLDQIDALYGVEAQIDEQGNIIASGNRGLLGQAIAFREQAEIEQRNRDLAEDRGRAQLDALRLEYDLADTESERRDIALRIYDVEQNLLESRLSSLANSKTIDKADKLRAKIALEALQKQRGAGRDVVERQFLSPLQRFASDAKDTDKLVEEAAVRRIERLNETITDAMTNALGIEDPFLRDLIGIFLDRNIFGPLAEGLSGNGGLVAGGMDPLSAVLAGIGGLFGGGSGKPPVKGRASGGYVGAGQLYRVNEGSSPGRVEAFVPNTSGQIIPLGRMNAMQGGGQSGGVSVVRLALSDDIDARIERVSGPVAIEVTRQSAPTLIEAAANETLRRAQRPTL